MIRFWKNNDKATADSHSCHSFSHFDADIWENSRKFFKKQLYDKEQEFLPILDDKGETICFAYQDVDADVELRKLEELICCKEGFHFSDVFVGYDAVEIYGCNELAWTFVNYLQEQKIPVKVYGEFWDKFHINENDLILDGRVYHVWAEGNWQRGRTIKEELFRSVSVCFECIDKIYEANLKGGKISNAEGDESWLIERLVGRDVVIIGTDIFSQDAYDWLYKKGIEARCFLSKQYEETPNYLFGKPVLGLIEIEQQLEKPVLINSSDIESAWGTGWIDCLNYYGYLRNKDMFCIRDYTDIPFLGLQHVLEKKRAILIGDIYACNWLKDYLCTEFQNKEIYYLDILDEQKKDKMMPVVEASEVQSNDLCFYVMTNDWYENVSLSYERQERYKKELKKNRIQNYSEYFASELNQIRIECSKRKSADITVKAVIIGAIDGNSGNILFRGILDGHPQIVKMDHCFLCENLFNICIRLSILHPQKIMQVFWNIYEKESGGENKETAFVKLELFENKMNELLHEKEYVTSVDLFLMFHTAFAFMWDNNIDMKEKFIYWEPHYVTRDVCEEYAEWLESGGQHGYIMNITRNSFTRAGSYFSLCERFPQILSLELAYKEMFRLPYLREKEFKNWDRINIAFEKLKCRPQKYLGEFCKKIGMAWSDELLKVTVHGKEYATRTGIKGFDLKPVFNQYEEYFTEYDRMRITLLTSLWQKKYGYSYIDITKYHRDYLQEMFMQNFLFEEKIVLNDSFRYKEEKMNWIKKQLRCLYRDQWIENQKS